MTTRREFLTGSAVSVAALAVAPQLVQPVKAEAVSSNAWWGYSLDGEIFHPLDVETKADAIAEAAAVFPDGGVTVAWCEEHPLSFPDYREAVVEYMVGYCSSLRSALLRATEGANEDADYEGEIAREMYRSDTYEFEREALIALDVALARIGHNELIGRDFGKMPLDGDEPLLDQIGTDAELEAVLQSAAQRWFDRASLWNVGPCTLTLSDEHDVPCSTETQDSTS